MKFPARPSSYLTATAWTVGGRNTDATYAGVITGNSITKVGTGTWTLSGNNTYTGATTISGGALQIGDGGNSGLLGAGNVTDNAALVFNRFDYVVVSNLVSGSGSLAQAGAGVLALAAANTYSGATFISAGTLALTNAGSIANSTNINLNNGAIFDLSGTTSRAMTLSGGKTISGDGVVNGSFTVGGAATLAPGNHDLGSLTFNNELTLASGSRTIMSVSHDSQANNAIAVAGAFTWGGALVVSNADDPLQAGDTFRLFSAGSFVGGFSADHAAGVVAGTVLEHQHAQGGRRHPRHPQDAAGPRQHRCLRGPAGVDRLRRDHQWNLLRPDFDQPRRPADQLDAAGDQPVYAGGNFTFTNAISADSAQGYYLLQLP